MYPEKPKSRAAIALGLAWVVGLTTFAVLRGQPASTARSEPNGKESEKTPEIKAISFAIDFGKVERGVILTHSVRIINTYNGSLTINGPRTS